MRYKMRKQHCVVTSNFESVNAEWYIREYYHHRYEIHLKFTEKGYTSPLVPLYISNAKWGGRLFSTHFLDYACFVAYRCAQRHQRSGGVFAPFYITNISYWDYIKAVFKRLWKCE